jgi:hypothetical protein
MKLNASTAIALALAFTSVAGNPVAVYASSVSEDSRRQDQPVAPQEQIDNASTSNLMCVRNPWTRKPFCW